MKHEMTPENKSLRIAISRAIERSRCGVDGDWDMIDVAQELLDSQWMAELVREVRLATVEGCARAIEDCGDVFWTGRGDKTFAARVIRRLADR